MAKYKNWYLARGSGMKDERKKLKLIILQCIAVITANFITIWYFEELFFRGFWYVIFASFILTFIYIIRSFCCLRKIRVFWFAAIPVFLFGIYLAFLFNDGIKKFLNEIRQIPLKVLDSEFFEEELLPSIRNDFSILSNYETMPKLSEKINARIICISGVHDPLVQRMSGWQRYTSNICSCVECEGAHFFLDDSLNISKINIVISRQLSVDLEWNV